MAAVPLATNAPYAPDANISVINPYLDQGYSYQDISALTGINQDAIRSYADTTRPGYGVPSPITAMLDANTNTPSGGVSKAGANGASYYNDQIDRINKQMDLLDPQLQIGKGNVDRAYQDQLDQIGLNESRANRDYTTNRDQTIQDQQEAKNGVNTQVRTQTNALQRMLGMAGSGNSSASQELAPYAVGIEGAQRLNGVNTTAERNLSKLDTGFNDFTQNIGISKADLAKKRDEQINGLTSGINSTRAQLLQTLAGLALQRDQSGGASYDAAKASAQPYLTQADQAIAANMPLAEQYRNPVLAANPVAYTPGTLDSYNPDGMTAATPGAPSYAPAVLPFYQTLFGNNKDKRAAA